MKSSSHGVIRLLGVLTVAALATACGGGDAGGEAVEGPWEGVVEAAKKERRVNFYSALDDGENARLVAAFNELYPEIDVSVTRGAGDLPPRVETEIETGTDGADVFVMSDPNWFTDNEQHLLEVDVPSVDGWGEDGWVVPGRAVFQSAYPFSMLVWNTDKFPDGFSDWEDLLEPEVHGQLGLRSDVTVSFAGFLDFQESELGADYLRASAEMNPRFYPSIVPMTQAVASGEIGVTNASTPSMVEQLQEQGAPLDFAVPKPSYWIQRGAGIIATSKRPNAARVFFDFLLSEEGQQISNGDGRGMSARDGIEGSIEAEDMTMLDSAHYTEDVLAQWTAKFDEYFR